MSNLIGKVVPCNYKLKEEYTKKLWLLEYTQFEYKSPLEGKIPCHCLEI